MQKELTREEYWDLEGLTGTREENVLKEDVEIRVVEIMDLISGNSIIQKRKKEMK